MKKILTVCRKGINEFQMLCIGSTVVDIMKFWYVVPCWLNKMEFIFIDWYLNKVLVWVCNIQHGLLLQHIFFIVSFVRISNAMDQMLLCCIAVFQYFSIIRQWGASANTCVTYHFASITMAKSLVLITGSLFHTRRSRSLADANTKRVMSDWANRSMFRLPETTDSGVDTAYRSMCHCLWLRFLPVPRVRSWFLLNAQSSGSGVWVGGFSTPLSEEGVLMTVAGLDTTQCIVFVSEVPLEASVLWLLVPSITV